MCLPLRLYDQKKMNEPKEEEKDEGGRLHGYNAQFTTHAKQKETKKSKLMQQCVSVYVVMLRSFNVIFDDDDDDD